MSEARVNNLSNESNTGGPTISGITTFSGTNYFVPPVGNTAQRPENPEPGSLRFNTDSKHLEYFKIDSIGWVDIEASNNDLGGGTVSNEGLGARMVVGGALPTYLNTVDYLTITTLGNTADFGDLSVIRGAQAFVSSRSRGVQYGGYAPGGGTNVIDYCTFASTGNFVNFGDVYTAWKADCAGASNQIRGVFGSGQNSDSSPHYVNMMDYLTIATTGDSVDFGDANAAKQCRAGCSNTTRGIWINNNYNTDIQYVNLMTTGNMQDFGDMNAANNFSGAGSNATRGIVSEQSTNVFEYITIASTGTSTDFGDKTTGNSFREVPGADPTRLVWAGARYYSGGYIELNTMQYLTIATTGNATDFGDLVMKTANGQQKSMGGSNGHGGL